MFTNFFAKTKYKLKTTSSATNENGLEDSSFCKTKLTTACEPDNTKETAEGNLNPFTQMQILKTFDTGNVT